MSYKLKYSYILYIIQYSSTSTTVLYVSIQLTILTKNIFC
jgi:hypothetical protein